MMLEENLLGLLQSVTFTVSPRNVWDALIEKAQLHTWENLRNTSSYIGSILHHQAYEQVVSSMHKRAETRGQ